MTTDGRIGNRTLRQLLPATENLLPLLKLSALRRPNFLSGARIAAVAPFLVFFLHNSSTGYWLCLAVLAFGLLTDFLDGLMARRYKLQSAFGAQLDNLADKAILASASICLVGAGRLWVVLAVVLVVRDFLVDCLRSSMAAKGLRVTHNLFGKSKVAAQYLGTSTALLALAEPAMDAPTALTVTNALFGVSLVFGVASGLKYWLPKRTGTGSAA